MPIKITPERRRPVVDLPSAGRTNGAIAAALGLDPQHGVAVPAHAQPPRSLDWGGGGKPARRYGQTRLHHESRLCITNDTTKGIRGAKPCGSVFSDSARPARRRFGRNA